MAESVSIDLVVVRDAIDALTSRVAQALSSAEGPLAARCVVDGNGFTRSDVHVTGARLGRSQVANLVGHVDAFAELRERSGALAGVLHHLAVLHRERDVELNATVSRTMDVAHDDPTMECGGRL